MIFNVAFAVTEDNEFEKSHFGDAKKFVLYAWRGDQFEYTAEMANMFSVTDEDAGHGSQKKGKQIIAALKSRQVDVLVAKQFGKNIRLVKQHFVPVVISEDTIDGACRLLSQKLQVLREQLYLKETGENKMVNFRKHL